AGRGDQQAVGSGLARAQGDNALERRAGARFGRRAARDRRGDGSGGRGGRRVIAELREAAEPGDDLVSEVIRLVESAGGLETARQRALDLAQQADAELDVLPPSPARDALQGSSAYAVERRS